MIRSLSSSTMLHDFRLFPSNSVHQTTISTLYSSLVCKIKAEPILYKVHPGGYFFRDTISLDGIDTLSCAKMARFKRREPI